LTSFKRITRPPISNALVDSLGQTAESHCQSWIEQWEFVRKEAARGFITKSAGWHWWLDGCL
jgi:hypothetical protein